MPPPHQLPADPSGPPHPPPVPPEGRDTHGDRETEMRLTICAVACVTAIEVASLVAGVYFAGWHLNVTI
jgi:hypothetical protein